MTANGVEAAIKEIAEEFSFLADWEERYGYVLDLARALSPLPEAARTEANKVRGCASQVWLTFDPRPESPDHIYFQGDSDAHLVRGLIAILQRVFSGKSAAEIIANDPSQLLAKLGLGDALTPQRSNGLYAMVQRIRAKAQEVIERAT